MLTVVKPFVYIKNILLFVLRCPIWSEKSTNESGKVWNFEMDTLTPLCSLPHCFCTFSLPHPTGVSDLSTHLPHLPFVTVEKGYSAFFLSLIWL